MPFNGYCPFVLFGYLCLLCVIFGASSINFSLLNLLFFQFSLSFSHESLNEVILSNMMFAPSSASVLSGSGPVFTATVNMLAATPALTPNGAFSTTIPSQGSTPAFLSPHR